LRLRHHVYVLRLCLGNSQSYHLRYHLCAFEEGTKDMPQITPFVWLAIGGVFATLCLGRGTVALAAWLAPIFLLRFARVMPPFAGLLSIWLVLLVAGIVSNRGVIPLSGLAYF